jgi:hypothetical protein
VQATEPMGESQEIDAFMVSEEIEAESTEAPAEPTKVEEVETAEDEAEIEAEADEFEADEELDEDQDEEAEDEPEELIAVKVDGEEIKLTMEQLKSGYSGQAKIQKGLQEVASKRKETEAMYTALEAAQKQFFEVVEQTKRQGVLQPPKKPDPRLADTNVAEYVRQNAHYEAQLGQYQHQQAQIRAQQQQKAEIDKRARAAYLQEQANDLRKSIPEFSDPKTAEEMRQNMTRVGTEQYGFSADEIDGVMDARALKVLADAVRYNMLKKSTPAAKRQEPARTVKPSARRAEPVQQKRANLLKKAAKTQSDGDWDAVFMTP